MVTLTLPGDVLRYIEGKRSLWNMFKIFKTTLESILGVYKDFLLNDFHSKTSKIAMISYILEDTWNHSDFACFWMKIIQKEVSVNAKYGLESGCKYIKRVR